MLKYGNKELRNIQEQVLKNASDIQAMNEINDIGIKVVGRIDSVAELPDPAEYEGEYGDTFAVGNEPPYNFYVFTRPFSEEIGPTWFCLGIVQLQGEKGDKGDQGEQGPQGEATEWTSGNYNTVIAPNPASYGNVGDYFLDTSNTGNRGYIFKKVSETAWGNTFMNIMGPQGPTGLQGVQGPQGPQGVQGPKGDTGDVGGFINIRAVIASTDLLPDPAVLNDPTAAYLVTADKKLYIQVGETKETRTWYDAGLLNVATYVTVDGQFQNTWDADSKADVTALDSYLPLSGGTITGELNVTGDVSLSGNSKLQATSVHINKLDFSKYDDYIINLAQGAYYYRFNLPTNNPNQTVTLATENYVDNHVSGTVGTSGNWTSLTIGDITHNLADVSTNNDEDGFLESVSVNSETAMVRPIVFSETEPETPIEGMIWLQPKE